MDKWDKIAEGLSLCCGKGCQADAETVAAELRAAYSKGVNDMLKRAISNDPTLADAAYLKGLEEGKEIADTYADGVFIGEHPISKKSGCVMVSNAIQSRIDEANGGKP